MYYWAETDKWKTSGRRVYQQFKISHGTIYKIYRGIVYIYLLKHLKGSYAAMHISNTKSYTQVK